MHVLYEEEKEEKRGRGKEVVGRNTAVPISSKWLKNESQAVASRLVLLLTIHAFYI
jgi:hypothetical protein